MSSPVALVKRPARAGTGPRVTSQLAGQEGLEPPTTGFGDRDSGQLSYCPVRGTAGMRKQPERPPSDVEVYVASGPAVEPQSQNAGLDMPAPDHAAVHRRPGLACEHDKH